MTLPVINRINEVFNSRKARKSFLKLRFPLLLILFFLLLPLVEKKWFFAGLGVSIIGELIQLWCFATIKTKKRLTTEGPYMFVRNPMYIGRFFLIFGILMITGNPWILLAYIIIYYFYMTNRVKREERLLSELFGQEYADYCRGVRPYMPTINSFFHSKKLFQFDSQSFAENHGVRNMAMAGVCYVILYIFIFIKPL
ncbi:MAG: isoprenylcysteine carboxylmethyltransferase family protein [Desulfobacteraceae bacterium]|nr:isoprenylcysteine carboxylmethyltransferase family protein [Desulfobacteraceae bacterium]MCF8095523.1 isoprenylcysteine carboxylmethyltransferase family protein [Desulfobacteraceae bacterium]